MHRLDALLEFPGIGADIPFQAPRVERGMGAEALDVKRRLGSFDAAHSPIPRLLEEAFPDATKNELISVAQVAMFEARSRCAGLPPSLLVLDRVTRRSKDLLIKWFHDHWMIIGPILPDISLADGDFVQISRNSTLD
jgi:hypothetical protein